MRLAKFSSTVNAVVLLAIDSCDKVLIKTVLKPKSETPQECRESRCLHYPGETSESISQQLHLWCPFLTFQNCLS